MLDDVTINDEYLDKLHEKNEYSGFDRTESVKIIRGLIRELRTLKVIARTMVNTLDRSDKQRELRARFDEESG